ncbi:hypothetical protein F441_15342 [Phytophthora nicotianae CJ01A1]|uniref:Uncharacterized protein n=1 Tax=Phytophthora nicotianae CJ01A1 TaxID=1317063 RepID=W2WE54_PHYNI|nr:hypothetical protein F441_15342 [Phytophthora nicotianae CJ01A1]
MEFASKESAAREEQEARSLTTALALALKARSSMDTNRSTAWGYLELDTATKHDTNQQLKDEDLLEALWRSWGDELGFMNKTPVYLDNLDALKKHQIHAVHARSLHVLDFGAELHS